MLTSSAFIFNKGKANSFNSGTTNKMTPTAEVGVSPNPLLLQSGLPKFKQIAPAHVTSAISENLHELKSEFSKLEDVLKNPQTGDSWGTRRIEYDYPTVIERLEKIQSPLAYSWGVVGHLMGVKNSPELRDAHQSMQPEVVKVYQHIGQSQPLFTALSALKKRQSVWGRLDETQQRIVTSALRQMENSGVGLDESKRKIFNEMQLELSTLSTKFNNNVLDSTKAFKLKLTDPADVDGLPDSAKVFKFNTFEISLFSGRCNYS